MTSASVASVNRPWQPTPSVMPGSQWAIRGMDATWLPVTATTKASGEEHHTSASADWNGSRTGDVAAASNIKVSWWRLHPGTVPKVAYRAGTSYLSGLCSTLAMQLKNEASRHAYSTRN